MYRSVLELCWINTIISYNIQYTPVIVHLETHSQLSEVGAVNVLVRLLTFESKNSGNICKNIYLSTFSQPLPAALCGPVLSLHRALRF